MVVTLEDIARRAGVARSTASRALADSPQVGLATRRRIQRLAEELGYVRNSAARALVTKRTHNLGMFAIDLSYEYTAELVSVVARTAQSAGYRLILAHAGNSASSDLESLRLLLELQIDAMFVTSSRVTDRFLPLLAERGMPVIFLDCGDRPGTVATDNVAAALMGVEYLMDLGHRRIGFVGAWAEIEPSRERQIGYECAHVARGISLDPSLVAMTESWPYAEGGCDGIRALLQLPDPPTALFCWNDHTAVRAIGEILARGMSIPDDVSVVGFDNINLCRFMHPPLTSIAQDQQGLAELAVQAAINVIEGGALPPPQRLPASLVIRDSAGPPKAKRLSDQ